MRPFQKSRFSTTWKVVLVAFAFVALYLVLFVVFPAHDDHNHGKEILSKINKVENQRKVQTVSKKDPITDSTTSVVKKKKPTLFHEPLEVTKTTKAYKVNSRPSCWIKGCSDASNWRSTVPCKDSTATKYNIQGVQSVKRMMSGVDEGLHTYHQRQLETSVEQFKKAIGFDPTCKVAKENLGLVLIKQKKYQEAIDILSSVVGSPRSGIYAGVAYEQAGNTVEAMKQWNVSISLDSSLEREYYGLIIPKTRSERSRIRMTVPEIEREAQVDYLLWKDFSEEGFANWGILPVDIADQFVGNRYVILRRMMPPYPLRALQRCYEGLISNNKLKLGDPQAKRYVAYQSRCVSHIHFAMADLVRKVVAHNAMPSYTYFGGYVGGSELIPHTDRFQCEFTYSINIKNEPEGKPWLLSLDYKPLFDSDDSRQGVNGLNMPPEERIVDADLYAGDALLFMGRHLIHFRRGALEEGKKVNQVFLHYVQEGFQKSLN